MVDIEIIKKMQCLRKIKPREEWVFFTKRKILNTPIVSNQTILKNIWQNLFAPIQKPALVFVTRAMALAMVVATGGFFYFFHLNQNQTVSEIVPQNSFSQTFENEKLVSALQGINTSLKKIDFSLAILKDSKNKKQTLAMTGITKATANNGEQIIKEIKRQDSASPQILASLNELETGFKEMGEKSSNIQIQTIKKAIDELKQMGLNEEDNISLQKIETHYNEGQYNEAVLLLFKIMDR